jgi:hypothetical protein
MRQRQWLASVLAMLPMAVLAVPLHIHKDQPFLQARTRLLKNHWKPGPMHEADEYRYEGVEKQLVTRGFKEVDSCSVDSSRCILYYKKGEHCLRLDTIGEQVKFMKVVQWSEECPAALQQKIGH